MSAVIEAAAERLVAATRDGKPCGPVRELIGHDDIALAYLVQQRVTRSRIAAGARLIGRKIGLTSGAVQRQIGVDQPDFGVLFYDMAVPHGDLVPSRRLLQPKAEAEIAFVLAADLDHGDLDEPQIRQSVEYAVAALEIVDSRVVGWDVAITDTVADNASSGLFVLSDRRVSLNDVDPKSVRMTMHRDGELVSEGSGIDCLGDPLAALAWLARTSRDLGAPLRAGEVVLSGALGPMVDAPPGSRIVADLSVLGRVEATFSDKESQE